MKLIFLVVVSIFIHNVSSSELKPLKDRSVPMDFFDGFKHIPAYEFAMKFVLLDSEFNSYVYACRFSYCHNEDRNNCKNACTAMAMKMDKEAIASMSVELTHPMTEVADCEKKCTPVCGKNECGTECAILCSVHFSYENCTEYMKEYDDLVIRFNRLVS